MLHLKCVKGYLDDFIMSISLRKKISVYNILLWIYQAFKMHATLSYFHFLRGSTFLHIWWLLFVSISQLLELLVLCDVTDTFSHKTQAPLPQNMPFKCCVLNSFSKYVHHRNTDLRYPVTKRFSCRLCLSSAVVVVGGGGVGFFVNNKNTMNIIVFKL